MGFYFYAWMWSCCYSYGAPLGGPSGCRSSTIIKHSGVPNYAQYSCVNQRLITANEEQENWNKARRHARKESMVECFDVTRWWSVILIWKYSEKNANKMADVQFLWILILFYWFPMKYKLSSIDSLQVMFFLQFQLISKIITCSLPFSIKTRNRRPNNIQKTSPQSYKTQIKILPFPGLA